MEQGFFLYKGYPLVRSGNSIYYGYMSDPYVVMMQIVHQNKDGDFPLADKIKIYQLSTDETRNPMERTIKTSERPSLFEALDLAAAWLRRAEQAENMKQA